MTMSDSTGSRLRKAMKDKGFASGADLARRMGVKEVTVRAHLNDTAGLTAKRAASYGRVLGVTPEWLLYGKQDKLVLPEDSGEAALMIVEYAQANSDRQLAPEEKLELVREFRKLIEEVRGE